MPNFNILKGYTDDLANQPIVDGYMYVTVDGQKLYIDDRTQRFAINAEKADILKGNDNALPAVPATPIAADEEISYSWEEINAIALSGHAQDWISVGAIKSVTLNEEVLGTTTHDIRVIGINQDNDQSITFQTKNCLNTKTAFSSSSAVWVDSTARSLCQSYYNAFPGKDAIKTVSKGTCSNISTESSRSDVVTYTDETVWLPSEREMGLDTYSPLSVANSTTSNAECTQDKNFSYAYYTSNTNRIKKQGDSGSANYYWERSRCYGSNSSNRVCRVNGDGSANYYRYNVSFGLAPAFVIGNPNLTSTLSLTVDDIYPYLVSHGGSIGQVLTKTNNGFDWQDATGGSSLSWGSFTDLE